MVKGPILNDNKNTFTTRNSLGIESVLTSIAERLCPVVTTVDDRAIYWPLMVWIYYEYENYLKSQGKNDDDFDITFLRRQDYFFVLSQIIVGNEDVDGMAGITAATKDYENNSEGPFDFNNQYYQQSYGGMLYASGGCHEMELIKDYDDDGEEYSFPHVTSEGEKMALAFKNMIKETAYYKDYLFSRGAIPKSVLEEYGKVISMGLKGFDECKNILREQLFKPEQNRLLKMSSEYVKFLVGEHNISKPTFDKYRYYLFDCYSPLGEKRYYPKELSEIVNGWEIMIGRQYLTMGIEMIWKYMLRVLENPLNFKEWFDKCINSSEFDYSLDESVESLLKKCDYSFEEREKMIDDARLSRKKELMISNGLKVFLSIYNRFANRTDIIKAEYYNMGDDSHFISIREVFYKIDEYKEKPIKSLLIYIMKEWLISQHLFTAYQKLRNGKDGFYIEPVEGCYYKKHDFDLAFQGIRLVQLTTIMRDLEMI